MVNFIANAQNKKMLVGRGRLITIYLNDANVVICVYIYMQTAKYLKCSNNSIKMFFFIFFCILYFYHEHILQLGNNTFKIFHFPDEGLLLSLSIPWKQSLDSFLIVLFSKCKLQSSQTSLHLLWLYLKVFLYLWNLEFQCINPLILPLKHLAVSNIIIPRKSENKIIWSSQVQILRGAVSIPNDVLMFTYLYSKTPAKPVRGTFQSMRSCSNIIQIWENSSADFCKCTPGLSIIFATISCYST